MINITAQEARANARTFRHSTTSRRFELEAEDAILDRQAETATSQYNALSQESKRLFWTVPAGARMILLNVPHITVVLSKE